MPRSDQRQPPTFRIDVGDADGSRSTYEVRWVEIAENADAVMAIENGALVIGPKVPR